MKLSRIKGEPPVERLLEEYGTRSWRTLSTHTMTTPFVAGGPGCAPFKPQRRYKFHVGAGLS